MVGLLGIGVGLTFGLAMRLSAYAGATMLMWAAALSPEHHPFLDDHVICSVVLLGLAWAAADRTWGFGGWWEDRVGSRFHALR